MKIFISDSALYDLDRFKEYFEAEGIPPGKQLVVGIIDHIQTLGDNPDIAGPDIAGIVSEFSESKIRELLHPPFRIVYVREQSSIHVVRVWRSERLLKLD